MGLDTACGIRQRRHQPGCGAGGWCRSPNPCSSVPLGAASAASGAGRGMGCGSSVPQHLGGSSWRGGTRGVLTVPIAAAPSAGHRHLAPPHTTPLDAAANQGRARAEEWQHPEPGAGKKAKIRFGVNRKGRGASALQCSSTAASTALSPAQPRATTLGPTWRHPGHRSRCCP